MAMRLHCGAFKGLASMQKAADFSALYLFYDEVSAGMHEIFEIIDFISIDNPSEIRELFVYFFAGFIFSIYSIQKSLFFLQKFNVIRFSEYLCV